MKDGYVLLVPTDPYHHPSKPAYARAIDALRTIAGDVWVDVWDKPEVTFFGERDAVKRVVCPKCSADLPLAWWHTAMDEAYRADMCWPELGVESPCCGQESRLDELTYEPNCLFGGFAFFVSEGTLCGPLDADQLAQVEGALGCPLRQAWQVESCATSLPGGECGSAKRGWEITAENQSDVPCSIFITYQEDARRSTRVENLTKGNSLTVNAATDKTIIRAVKVNRGTSEMVLTQDVELSAGKRYAVVVAEDGRVTATVLDR